jgi:transcription elongation factor Elf1
MAKVYFELDCDSCGSEWEIRGTDAGMPNQPIHCPFCGTDLNLADLEIEEEIDQLDWFEDYDE